MARISYQFIKKIISVKPSLHEIHKRLYYVNENFEYLTNIVFDYVIFDRAIRSPDKALLELDRIEKCLNDNILSRLKDFSPYSIQGHGVFQTFFIIFISHCFLCHDIDRIQINNDTLIEKLTTNIYLEQFKLYKDVEFEFDIEKALNDDNIINKMIENLSSKEKDSQVEMLLNLISYNVQITDNDFKNYKYALKKFSVVAKWFNKSIDLNQNKKIKAQYIISIMQEILDVVCNNPKDEGYNIVNDYFKYKNKKQTLLSALRNPEKANTIIVEGWVKRLENRLAVNLGGRELIIKKRKIDNIIYEIKKFVYSFQNLEDIEFVGRFLSEKIFELLLSEEDANIHRDDLIDKMSHQLKLEDKSIRIIIPYEARNILSFFKELHICGGKLNDKIAKDIVCKIINTTSEETDIQDLKFHYSIQGQTVKHEFILFCKFDTKSNTLFFMEYRRIVEDDYIERAKRLGLEKFFKNI